MTVNYIYVLRKTTTTRNDAVKHYITFNTAYYNKIDKNMLETKTVPSRAEDSTSLTYLKAKDDIQGGRLSIALAILLYFIYKCVL